MANKIKIQKLIDHQKRALIKITMASDGTAESNNRIIDASMLSGALNANGYIMSGNTHTKSRYRHSIKRILVHAKVSGQAAIQWEGGANDEIIQIVTGTADFNLAGSSNEPAVFTMPDTANGDILLSGTFAANDAFNILIDIKKDAQDYDAGQTSDPMAFNKGSRALI